jgi:hypothetical protein
VPTRTAARSRGLLAERDAAAGAAAEATAQQFDTAQGLEDRRGDLEEILEDLNPTLWRRLFPTWWTTTSVAPTSRPLTLGPASRRP